MTEFSFGDELEESLKAEELRALLRDAHVKLAKAKNKTEAVTEAAFAGAHAAFEALGKPKPITVPGKGAKGKPEVALWHLTDWQGAKLTTSYNTEVMRKRVHAYVKRACKITEIQRLDHDVNECVIAFGGDMIEGLFNFPTQPFEIDATLFDQYVTVAMLIAEVVRAACSNYTKVTVVPEWGNHGRIGSKRDAVPLNNNFDRMTYRLAKSMLDDVPNLIFQECPEGIQRLEVGDYRALVIHGDEVGRGGYASPTTIVQHITRWASGSYPWDFRDVYMGHYHTHAQWPLPNGEGSLFQTGSTESDNLYARIGLGASANPSQRLHFINPRQGRVTAQYQVWLEDIGA